MHDERQVYQSQIDAGQNENLDTENIAYHYVKNHDYAPDDFSSLGEITCFDKIKVVDKSDSGESEEFEGFAEMRQSDWTVNWATGARLTDGTILFEGQR